jgi:Uma2 family endonuclease
MATTLVPLEVYLQTEYEPAAEYVDGVVEERPMGEDQHSAWQVAITDWFRQNRVKWNILVRTELRVQTSATRFRIPDVAILDAAVAPKPTAADPPIAVFEILSPEDRVQRLIRKLGDYAAMGVPEIWVIDPEAGTFSRFEDGQLLHRERFSAARHGIEFEMAEIARLVE